MRNATSQDLMNAFRLAQEKGWKTFRHHVFSLFGNRNSSEYNTALMRYLERKIENKIESRELPDADLALVWTSLALLLWALRPLPRVNHLTIEEVDSQMSLTPKEDADLQEIRESRYATGDDEAEDVFGTKEREVFAGLAQRRQRILQEAERFMLQHMLSLHTEYYTYVRRLCQGKTVLFDAILYFTWLTLALLIRQEENDSISCQVTDIFSVKKSGP